MKSAIVLLELIFSIVLFSIIALITTDISYNLYKKKSTKIYQTFSNIKLETTRLFLIKHGLTNISYSKSRLYFGSNLLLDNISSYEASTNGFISTIDICIDENRVCQQWKIQI